MSSDPAIGTEAAWFCGLLQAGDSFYPTGSYAHSFGLEGLVQAGVVSDRESLKAYFEQSVLPTLERVELPFQEKPTYPPSGTLCASAPRVA